MTISFQEGKKIYNSINLTFFSPHFSYFANLNCSFFINILFAYFFFFYLPYVAPPQESLLLPKYSQIIDIIVDIIDEVLDIF